MKLVFAVYAAFYGAVGQGLDDGRHALEEVVAFLLAFQAGVENVPGALDGLLEGLSGTHGGFIADEDAYFVELLPVAV